MPDSDERLELGALRPAMFLSGVDAHGPVEILASSAVAGTASYNVAYRRGDGSMGIILLDASTSGVEIVGALKRWTFDDDPELFRLTTEARRIRFAYLFDPVLAVHTSLVDALPHQITAVYQELLTRSPLRFLLADDPGAGKTIMTGLFIRELIARGDLQRCLIVAPGSLVEQWQDELESKFHLGFSILTTDQLEASSGSRWFEDHPLAIARLDKLSRDDDLQTRLAHLTPWDLIVVDEAHKMSATLFGREVKRTKRYQLGQLLGTLTRHLLLLSATPHNGKEADFQLFLSLIDPDRFEGKYRDEHGTLEESDVSDIMRRLVKEDLLRFDGRRLFPQRRASTVGFELSALERQLYEAVTSYVREQFNRADRLGNDRRRGNIGFALTILQRRLASSTAAISASLTRRRERLERKLDDHEGNSISSPTYELDELDEIDDLPDPEAESIIEELVDESTTARTIEELRAEIAILRDLEKLAMEAQRDPSSDCKWRELASILSDDEIMIDSHQARRKFVIFTEHRDTLTYLVNRLRLLRGRHDAVVTIHGGMRREERKLAETSFRNDPAVEVLVATDAAGEGINLQRAHLMANYDLPWNPNRIEQRFGRIHRIGQTEVCHLWNFLALDTREGDVFAKLFDKIETQRQVLGDGIFDILGLQFRNAPLRDLMLEAIRYGGSAEAKFHSEERLDNLLDVERARKLMAERALAADTMDLGMVQTIRADMERAEARRLQPHFVRSFFFTAFERLGGSYRPAEEGRYEITFVPSELRNNARALFASSLPRRYERIAFEKSKLSQNPRAEFLCPGHPLLDTVVDKVLTDAASSVSSGVAIDRLNSSVAPRFLFIYESTIQDGRTTRFGRNELASRELVFIELMGDGTTRNAGFAPHLDYRAPHPNEASRVLDIVSRSNFASSAESYAQAYAVDILLPRQLTELSIRTKARVERVRTGVRERLTREIIFHEARAAQLEADQRAGKQLKMNYTREIEWADELRLRLKNRIADLHNQEQLSAVPPRLLDCALIIPEQLLGSAKSTIVIDAAARAVVEMLAMQAVMAAELALGFEPRDVSSQNLGYDVESAVPGEGRLRFIEVKGRVAEATTVAITRNEIITALNKPDEFILAIVLIAEGKAQEPRYIRRPFLNEPDQALTSSNFVLSKFLQLATGPS